MNWLGNVWERFVWGRNCLGCGGTEGPLNPWICPRCDHELAAWSADPLWVRPGEAVCLYPMEPLIHRLVLALKYRSMPGLAAYLVARTSLGDDPRALGLDLRGSLFVPVPIHAARKRERGYNQSQLLANALARVCGATSNGEVLRRVAHRDSQTLMNREERSRNVVGAFRAELPVEKRGCPIVLVDDVYTTGATTSACRRALEKAGAGSVLTCALAFEKPVTAAVDWIADNKGLSLPEEPFGKA